MRNSTRCSFSIIKAAIRFVVVVEFYLENGIETKKSDEFVQTMNYWSFFQCTDLSACTVHKNSTKEIKKIIKKNINESKKRDHACNIDDLNMIFKYNNFLNLSMSWTFVYTVLCCSSLATRSSTQ